MLLNNTLDVLVIVISLMVVTYAHLDAIDYFSMKFLNFVDNLGSDKRC
jgi:hypothetical protein